MLIAGAGIIGLSCAWALVRRGISVTVCDAGIPALEASWAGAGMLAPGGEFDAPSALITFALDSLCQYPEFIAELETESDLPIDFRRSGAIELAFSDAEAEELTRKAARQEAFGIRSEACKYNGLAARFYPDDAVVDPRDVTRALLAVLRKRGVAVRQNEPVRNAAQIDDPDGLLIAAGAWSSGLMDGLPRTMPVRGHLISWNLQPGHLEPILRHGHTYLLQRKSGVLIAGSTTEHVGFDRTIDEAAVADIHTRAARLMPALAGMPPSEKWNGFRPGIAANEPMIGRLPGTNIWTAFGHYRNGILLAPETARQIADSVSATPAIAGTDFQALRGSRA